MGRRSVKANELAIRALKPGAEKYEVAVLEHRGLIVRVLPSGTRTFLLRYRQDGSLKRVALAAQTLAAARAEWETQRRDVRQGGDPAEKAKAAKDEKRRARLMERASRIERETGAATLARLCTVYCDHLQARGKVSARKVRADLDRYVVTGPREKKVGGEKPAARAVRERVSQLLAREVTRSDAAQLIRSIAETGKHRTAGLIRSYLKAAYALALGAEGDAQAPSELIAFRIEGNPLADVKAIPVRKRDRTLSVEELRAFMKRLDAAPGHITDALWFCLLSAGQRPMQALRATVEDYHQASADLVLRDGKGKRSEPRIHVIPLAPRGRRLAEKLHRRAKALREAMAPEERDALGPPLLFSTHGKVPLDIGTLSFRVTEISRAMVAAGESASPFQMKDLRRTVETMLAATKVSKDVRAQLLSHGISGVQATHYDRHDYLQEKRQALATWERKLAEIQGTAPAKVVPIRAA